MNTLLSSAQGSTTSDLTIGDLAERTGVSQATLRMWEQRHGFPRPERLASGHRRYTEADAVQVSAVVRRRDAGVRLDAAISEALAEAQRAPTPALSVYAELRRLHPHLMPYRLRKKTLLALSWAFEDEFCARADRAHLFGSFQTGTYYAPARARWSELARVAKSAFVFADFAEPTPGAQPVEVALPEDAPMRREWLVVCDSLDFPAALTAFEIPGQTGVPKGQRLFEAIWTLDPTAVRDAARTCALIAADVLPADAAPVLYGLADRPPAGLADLASVTSMFNRVVAYVDSYGR